MAQGRRSGQPQSNLPRLTGRISPQQSLRKVGPAISEVLRTSVRPRPRTDTPTKSKQQVKFRPNSGADAILCLDEEAEAEYRTDALEQDSRVETKGDLDGGSLRIPVPPTKLALPKAGRPSGKQFLSIPLGTPKLRSTPAPSPVTKEAVKVQLPGLLINRQPNYGRNRRVSKALPSLPPPTPSPCRASFAPPPRPSIDVFETNRGKVLRGQGQESPVGPSPSSITFAPAPPTMENYGNSSGSSYDSAEQTWSMINSMMNAVNEDEVRRARESIKVAGASARGSKPASPVDVRSGARGSQAFITFPRMRDARPGRGHDARTSASSDRTYRTSSSSSTDSSSTIHSPTRPRVSANWQDKKPPHFSGTFPQQRSVKPSLDRRVSVASSIFSIVIQPTRERSNEGRPEAQDALVEEGNFPLRIKDILQLQYNHGRYEPSPYNRTYSRTSSSSTSEEGAELHPDVALTIDALRSVEMEEIAFF